MKNYELRTTSYSLKEASHCSSGPRGLVVPGLRVLACQPGGIASSSTIRAEIELVLVTVQYDPTDYRSTLYSSSPIEVVTYPPVHLSTHPPIHPGVRSLDRWAPVCVVCASVEPEKVADCRMHAANSPGRGHGCGGSLGASLLRPWGCRAEVLDAGEAASVEVR
jgi:hypothetical protein